MEPERKMEIEQDKQKIMEAIKAEGIGAPVKWSAIATSAMAGNQEAIVAIKELLGKPPKTVLDLYMVSDVAAKLMTPGELKTEHDKAKQMLGAMANPKPVANKYLGNRLGKMRKERGFTQEQLAKACGMPVVTLQKLENGTNNIRGARAGYIYEICKTLDCTFEDLLGIDAQ